MDNAIVPPKPRRGGLIVPVVLIVLGSIFLLGEFVPHWGISRTWPVILIVVGLVKLIESGLPPRPPEGPRV